MTRAADPVSVRFVPGPDLRTDAALLTAHVGGDRRAFTELLIRHRPQLYRLARRRSGNRQDAEDAVQDAFLAAHGAATRFRHDATVGSWLHRIVLNACLDRRRSTAARALLVDVPARAPAADHAERVNTAMVVHQALLRLPAEQRAAVAAIDMYGYTVADAALLLGVAEGTIKSRCSRGRARLAVLLGPPS